MNEEDVCSICLEKPDIKSYTSLCCKNKFHFECLNQWFKINNTCPLCRSEYKHMKHYNDDFEEYIDYIKNINMKKIVNNVSEILNIYKLQSKELRLNFITNILEKTEEVVNVLHDYCDEQ